MASNIPRGNVLTGCRCMLIVDGSTALYMTGLSMNEETQREGVKELGNIRTAENVALGYECSFSASAVRILGSPLQSEEFGAINPPVGNSPDEHLRNVLNREPWTGLITDIKTGRTVYRVEQAEVTRVGTRVDARSMMMYDVDFVAIVIKNESEL